MKFAEEAPKLDASELCDANAKEGKLTPVIPFVLSKIKFPYKFCSKFKFSLLEIWRNKGPYFRYSICIILKDKFVGTNMLQ